MIDTRDKAYYAMMGVPTPTFCPSCRLQRRLAWRNERNFYSRQCDLCKNPIITVYAPDAQKTVYCYKCWWSDQWDATDYARDIDWAKPFFPQFAALRAAVPALALMNDNGAQSENCEYTYDFSRGKNAYLIISSWFVENSMYGYQVNRVKDVYDCYFVFDSELIYEGIAVEKSYGCAYVMNTKACRDIIFGYDLQNCSDCILSAGLRNKQYCIWNQQYTQAEYEQKKKDLQLDNQEAIEKLKIEFKHFLLKVPRRFANLVKCENSTGDYLLNSANTDDSYLFNALVNCRFCTNGDGAKDCYDIINSGNPELCYDSVTPDDSYNNLFTIYCWKSQFISYSENCHSSKELFGCVGMKKGQYAIFNKTYHESEYKTLKQKMIAHMQETGEYGVFFPITASPFAYNESAAQESFPLTQDRVQTQGYRWKTDLPQVKGKKDLLHCSQCGNNYKIQPTEAEFYRRMQLPSPQFCINCRYRARLQRLNPLQLWHRQCMCTQTDHQHQGLCSTEFDTTYSPERKEIVYCEGYYQKEVY